jgi:hypothetical protein
MAPASADISVAAAAESHRFSRRSALDAAEAAIA